MILECAVGGFQNTICYLLGCNISKEVAIIDPACEAEKIYKVINRYNLKPKLIINTHGHIDHIESNDKFGLPVYIHELDAECLTSAEKNLSLFFFGKPWRFDKPPVLLKDKDKINIGELTLEIIHTPGHTPGSICIKAEKGIFTGDTLLCHTIGRTDVPGSSYEGMIKSIKEKLFTLSDDTVIYPAHGPSSTIGKQKSFFQDEFSFLSR